MVYVAGQKGGHGSILYGRLSTSTIHHGRAIKIGKGRMDGFGASILVEGAVGLPSN